jgi:hypothetical protein
MAGLKPATSPMRRGALFLELTWSYQVQAPVYRRSDPVFPAGAKNRSGARLPKVRHADSLRRRPVGSPLTRRPDCRLMAQWEARQ